MAQSLRPLIDLLKGLTPADNFGMDRWFHPCGSPSCAAGWATTIPEYQEAGLTAAGLTAGDSLQEVLGLSDEDLHLAFGTTPIDPDIALAAGVSSLPYTWTSQDSAKVLEFIAERMEAEAE